jgi:hypothetical protein
MPPGIAQQENPTCHANPATARLVLLVVPQGREQQARLRQLLFRPPAGVGCAATAASSASVRALHNGGWAEVSLRRRPDLYEAAPGEG